MFLVAHGVEAGDPESFLLNSGILRIFKTTLQLPILNTIQPLQMYDSVILVTSLKNVAPPSPMVNI